MTKEISWSNIPESDKRLLAMICPECRCSMQPHKIDGLQKCGGCGYTRENPADSDTGGEEFNLILKTFKSW